jgi:hypothetical protein
MRYAQLIIIRAVPVRKIDFRLPLVTFINLILGSFPSTTIKEYKTYIMAKMARVTNSGWISQACMILPVDNRCMALVAPQVGHGRPVIS